MSKKKKVSKKKESKVGIPEVAPEGVNVPSEVPKQIKLANKIQKRNTFLADAIRNERDAEYLNATIGRREYKGKIKTVTTVKHYEVDEDGFFVTEFTIDLKE